MAIKISGIEVISDTRVISDTTINPSNNTIDGDVLDITFTPANYTPDASIAEATDVDDLAAHLKGVDTALVSLTHSTTTGSTQTVDFANDYQTIDTGSNTTVTLSFSSTKPAVDTTILVDATNAPGWNLSAAAYDYNSFSISAQGDDPEAVFFKSDGTSMYIIAYPSNIYQYTLSTAWDVSTASYASKSISVGGRDANPRGLFFKPDGTSMYFVGKENYDVYQYTLSTAWDLSTASYDYISFSVQGWELNPEALFFKSDGTSMYIIGSSGETVYQYTLSTAWDVSTASYANKSFSVGINEPSGLFFEPAGTRMYIVDAGFDNILQYTLSTAWDVSTASYANKSISVSNQDTNPRGVFFNASGTRMYVVGKINSTVYQYTLADISIVFPSSLETVELQTPFPKSVYKIATVDGGTSYQLVSKTEEVE